MKVIIYFLQHQHLKKKVPRHFEEIYSLTFLGHFIFPVFSLTFHYGGNPEIVQVMHMGTDIGYSCVIFCRSGCHVPLPLPIIRLLLLSCNLIMLICICYLWTSGFHIKSVSLVNTLFLEHLALAC